MNLIIVATRTTMNGITTSRSEDERPSFAYH